MLRLVNAMGNNPINVGVDSSSTFEPGQIGQRYMIDGATVGGRSNGMAPFGVIDDIRTSTEDTTARSKRITIWHKRGVFETDQYDTRQRYLDGTSLFVGTDGLLTTVPNPMQEQEVGICCVPPSAVNGAALRFLWLGREW
jgi:hypothetical protein